MIYKKTRSLRLLMRSLLAVAVVLAGLDLLLLAMRLTGVLEPGQVLGARVFSAAVSVALLAAVFVVISRLEHTLKEAEKSRARLQGAIDALPATFELYDADDRLVLWNQAFVNAFPQTERHLKQHPRSADFALATATQPGDGARSAQANEPSRRERSGLSGTLSEAGQGGWMRRYERRLSDGSRVAIQVDVTEAEEQRLALDATRRALDHSQQRLKDAIEALPAGFEMYDGDDRLIMVNSTNVEMYPELADLADRQPTFEQVVRANAERGGLPLLHEPGALDSWIAQRQQERRQPSTKRVHRVAENRWVRVHERRMQDGGLVAIRLDISDLMQREADLIDLSRRLERMNEDLSALSHTDALTGLANRRAFDLRLQEEVADALQRNASLALLLVDVDHFKRFNDHYGHPAGDECLRLVAHRLRESATRPADMVVRLGGEEFALLVPNHNATTALTFAERCVRHIEAGGIEHMDSPVSRVVTVSIGVAELSGCEAPTPAALLSAADAALYQAKQQGRNRACVATQRRRAH